MLLAGDRSVYGLLPQLAGGGGARVGRSGTLRVTEGVPQPGTQSNLTPIPPLLNKNRTVSIPAQSVVHLFPQLLYTRF